jgi:hypothetical protein
LVGRHLLTLSSRVWPKLRENLLLSEFKLRMELEFERRLTKDDIKELIYREILEYYPQLLKDYINGAEGTTSCILGQLNHNRHFLLM